MTMCIEFDSKNNPLRDMLENFSNFRCLASAILILQSALTLESRLAFGEFPRTQIVRLSDGRFLEYAEYGDPSGPLVLYFHGTPGSHLEVHAASEELSSSGIHIVAINRPGIGNSTYHQGRTIMDWPDDVADFLVATNQGDKSFGVIGFSGGTPYALACAHAMPQRVTRVAIVSGHTSLGIPGVAPGKEDRFIELFLNRPRLAKKAVKVTRKRLRKKPDKIVARVTKRWDPSDQALINGDPFLKGVLEASLKHATLRSEQGIVTDTQLLGCHWGFDLTQIHGMPISIWHGEYDSIAPASMGRYFHSWLANSTLHLNPNAGHVTMFKWHSAEIHKEFAIGHFADSPQSIIKK